MYMSKNSRSMATSAITNRRLMPVKACGKDEINQNGAGPPRTSPLDPLAQLGSSQLGSNLVANCAVYAGFSGSSGC